MAVIHGNYGNVYELSGYPILSVNDYVKVFEDAEGIHAKSYTPFEHELEKGKITALSTKNGDSW